MQYDVAIIGGSFAGLSAATQIARGRRKVVVIDAGLPRNRFAAHSHGFLSRDGAAPHDILAEARKQLGAYSNARIIDGFAENASGVLDDFHVGMADGSPLEARRIVLAGGVSDTLADVPGLATEWGRRVVHCPYCHGYEFGDGPFGVLATGPMAIHHAMLVPDWGPTTLFLNGAFEPDAEQLEKLARRGVEIEGRSVVEVRSGDDSLEVLLAGGRARRIAAIFTAPRIAMSSSIPAQLGCALADGPFGSIVQVDEMKKTSVPGVFAAGDMARFAPSVPFAVADGAMAGAAAHQSLIFG
jgi:thioredoxin reductase